MQESISVMTASAQYSALIMAPQFKVEGSPVHDPSCVSNGRLLASRNSAHTRQGKAEVKLSRAHCDGMEWEQRYDWNHSQRRR
jgi:hypothetical protein